jgi:DNA-binding transcriptional MerR regulator
MHAITIGPIMTYDIASCFFMKDTDAVQLFMKLTVFQEVRRFCRYLRWEDSVMSQDSGKWVLVEEIREILAVSRSTIDARVKKGLLASHMEKGRRWYWLAHSPAILTELRCVRAEISHIKMLLAQFAEPQPIKELERAQPAVRARAPRPQKRRLPSRRGISTDTEWKAHLCKRIEASGSVHALAKDLNVSPTAIYRWRKGQRAPSDAVITLLSKEV